MADRTAEKAYNVTVTGRNVEVTEAMKQYALDKVSKIERFTNRIIDVSVTLDVQREEHRVDIILKAGHLTIKSRAVTSQMYASIDQAVHRLERRLRRYKDRLQEHQAKGLQTVDMQVNVLRAPFSEVDEINDQIEEETLRRIEENLKPGDIVEKETIPLHTLNYAEAVMKMELSTAKFMIFRYEGDQNLKVIYRRADGNYGVIEAE